MGNGISAAVFVVTGTLLIVAGVSESRRIDQNSERSRELSLRNRRGSEVIRGNRLAVPLFYRDDFYFPYVEPIFPQAENAPMPEIKCIPLGDNESVDWADNFEDAMHALIRNNRAVAGMIRQLEKAVQFNFGGPVIRDVNSRYEFWDGSASIAERVGGRRCLRGTISFRGQPGSDGPAVVCQISSSEEYRLLLPAYNLRLPLPRRSAGIATGEARDGCHAPSQAFESGFEQKEVK